MWMSWTLGDRILITFGNLLLPISHVSRPFHTMNLNNLKIILFKGAKNILITSKPKYAQAFFLWTFEKLKNNSLLKCWEKMWTNDLYEGEMYTAKRQVIDWRTFFFFFEWDRWHRWGMWNNYEIQLETWSKCEYESKMPCDEMVELKCLDYYTMYSMTMVVLIQHWH